MLGGVFDLPYDFVISGFFRANSSKPFNAFIPQDLNGDGFVYGGSD